MEICILGMVNFWKTRPKITRTTPFINEVCRFIVGYITVGLPWRYNKQQDWSLAWFTLVVFKLPMYTSIEFRVPVQWAWKNQWLQFYQFKPGFEFWQQIWFMQWVGLAKTSQTPTWNLLQTWRFRPELIWLQNLIQALKKPFSTKEYLQLKRKLMSLRRKVEGAL